jgi:SAM-dependent methyltransferase
LSPTAQVQINAAIWRQGEYVASYANRRLLPVEVMILVRYREALSRRTLEVGCGAGRVLGYLVALGGEVHGIDISPAMVEHCRARYPTANVRVGDLAVVDDSGIAGPFDVIIAADNVLDVFDDHQRRRVLTDLKALIAPEGLLIFSSHNLAYADNGAAGSGAARGRLELARKTLAEATGRPAADVIRFAARLPRRIRNRRRLGPLQQQGSDHAIINDSAHDYALLHYYIRRDDQARQLAEAGYELLECLDVDGRPVGAGDRTPDPWLHYVARSSPGARPSTTGGGCR